MRDAGFENINLDLILSLPGESLTEVKVSLDEAMALDPEHISLYELTIEPRTAFWKWYKGAQPHAVGARHVLPLPNEDEQFKILSYARNFLKKNGFTHYELLNFAKPGFESQHNLLYWANEEYLGLGPGAFSYLDGRRFQFAESYEQYMRKIKEGDWKPFGEETLAPDKKKIESLLLALRRMEGADVNRFGVKAKHALPLHGNIESLKTAGLLEESNGKIRLTERGQFFAERVFTDLSSV